MTKKKVETAAHNDALLMHEVEKRDNGQQSSKYLWNSSLSPFSSVANSLRKILSFQYCQLSTIILLNNSTNRFHPQKCRNFSEKKENIEEEARFQVSL